MAGRVIFWRGTNRRGRHQMGQAAAVVDLVEWVKARYDAGWTSLRVSVGDTDVAGIGLDANGAERVWWAEDWVGAGPRKSGGAVGADGQVQGPLPLAAHSGDQSVPA